MRAHLITWIVAFASAISTIISSTFDVLLAGRTVNQSPHLSNLHALLYTAFSLQVIILGSLFYYCLLFARLAYRRQIILVDPKFGAGLHVIALTFGGIATIWLLCRPDSVAQQDRWLIDAGFVTWISTIVLHSLFFILLQSGISRALGKLTKRRRPTESGISLPANKDLVFGSRPSFCSRDMTLASSRPCTPASSRTYSLQSSTTKVASSLRSKVTRSSARSSVELSPFQAGEATVLGSAFDRYDTSAVSPDVRSTMLTPSKLTRSGLEPIPGSRPGSPEDESSPILPVSPTIRQQKTHRVRNVSGETSLPSSPLSSRNFSRPASRTQGVNTSLSSTQGQLRVPVSMTDLIHPLFRPDSPSPPQILTSTTMVTASPLANQPITPKTLNRLRSKSDLQQKQTIGERAVPQPSMPIQAGQWRVMPPPEDFSGRPRSKSHSSITTRRPSTSGSDSSESLRLHNSTSIGSPGPSIIEEDELPPILPGFVLTAGSRSSLIGYGKRKSTKRASAHLL